MSLKVKEFRQMVTQHSDAVAIAHIKALKRRKLGFSFREAFAQKPQILLNIVAEAVLEANEPLLESSNVRVPEWMGIDTFNSLTAKMSLYGNHI